MKKLLLIVLLLKVLIVQAITPDELLLANCHLQGHTVYNLCIKSVPAKECPDLYANYVGCLHKLNLPYRMKISRDSSPYSYSPYDICKFETAHIVVLDLCPSNLN